MRVSTPADQKLIRRRDPLAGEQGHERLFLYHLPAGWKLKIRTAMPIFVRITVLYKCFKPKFLKKLSY